ncbi:MAG: dTDP-4-dehydrorhamnose 3,5-epimerase [Acidimicrobiia bacterium]
MIFTETPLPGAFVIDLEMRQDERGFFARAWGEDEFREHGLETRVAQCNMSYNYEAGTLRGLHYQLPPHCEVKLVRCTRGAIWDVIVDLREGSPTYKAWFGLELTADNRRMLYVPEQFAHGYLTLTPGTEIFYQVSEFYSPGHEAGIRWDDPAIRITWPEMEVRVISDKDASHPDYEGRTPRQAGK